MAPSVLDLPVVELAARLAAGSVRTLEVAEAVNERISRLDGELKTFAFHDPSLVLRQAEALDRHRATRRPLGRLHGVPVALKDIIDTSFMPTANGTAIDADRRPDQDAAIVSLLRREGALIVGKTVTTELAFLAPAKTINPHDSARTPGGSSAGSAAAVAAGIVPLAVGTQTGGSVIRPAAFCGTVGYKPTFGAIPRTGVLLQSQTLDSVGVFARDVEGAALLAQCLFGSDHDDNATFPQPAPELLEAVRSKPPVAPTFALIKTPWWDRTEDATREAFSELANVLGDQMFEFELPEPFPQALELRQLINDAEMASNFARYARHTDALSPEITSALERGRKVAAVDYLAALKWRDVMLAGLREVFDRCDAIITPSAPGAAPGRETTGDASFAALWTYLGLPTITLPLMNDANDMPLGIQLVGRTGDDARLLRNASWMDRTLSADA